MENFYISTLLLLAIVYAPWFAALFAGKSSSGTWKFFAFIMSTLALVGLFFFFVPGVIAWLIGFGCAAAANSAANSVKSAEATVAKLRD